MLTAREVLRQKLSDRRAALEAKLAGTTASERSRTYAKQVELPRVAAAFARVADGSYGTCIACGEAIDPKRLDAMPEVPDCKACEKPKTKS